MGAKPDQSVLMKILARFESEKMKPFFEVTDLETVYKYISEFRRVETEAIPLWESFGRVLAQDIVSDVDLPDFARATMDGYAVCASSTFGASEGNPAYLDVRGAVRMGQAPAFAVGRGEAAHIATGGMLPEGSDSVVMIEHTAAIDDTTIEVYKSVAPGQHCIEIGQDFRKDAPILSKGRALRPQETGLLAAFGYSEISVFKKPVVGIVSTGDEVVSIEETPPSGKIRDINTYTLAGQVYASGGIPVSYGIVGDEYDSLLSKCSLAVSNSDMVLVSGGSSVGMRDLTVEVLDALTDARILFHGIPISPGKPTILAKVQNKAFWGIPGHVVSAMVVFERIVNPFMTHMGGRQIEMSEPRVLARLSRNLPSAQGCVDYIRVKLIQRDKEWWAEPILGKSALINTMVKADGLIEIDINSEGLDQGTQVKVIPI